MNGLHILNWNPDLIGVKKDVQDHLDYMHTNHEVKLCYTSVYKLSERFKFSFLNTCSLSKHKEDIISNKNMLASDIILLAETKLSHGGDSNDYHIEGCNQILRNDQIKYCTDYSHHGLAAFAKSSIKLLEVQRYTSDHLECMYLCVPYPHEFEPIQLICVYVSPHLPWVTLQNTFDDFMTDIDSSPAKTIIMGDFNMKSIVNDAKYNEKIIGHMKMKYNMMQYINECTTEHKSMLDLCFATCDITSTVI